MSDKPTGNEPENPDAQGDSSLRKGTRWTPAQKKIVDELAAEQVKLGLSDAQFCAQWFKDYSTGTWNLSKSDSYAARDNAKVFAAIDSTLRRLRRVLRQNASSTQGRPFHELPIFSAILKSVDECMTTKSEKRLTVYVGPTGAGKSRIQSELSLKTGAKIARANETWANSYYFALCDVIRALSPEGTEYEMPRNAMYGRAMMLGLTRADVLPLGIDEGNYFGPRSINLVKDILNETTWPVLLTLTPTAWVRMQRHAHEFSQLRRRLKCVYHHEPITAKDAELWLGELKLGADLARACIHVADAAKTFGSYDFLERVVDAIDAAEISKPVLEDVVKATASVKKELGLAEAGK